MRISDDEQRPQSNGGTGEQQQGLSHLVDASNNQYVLTKSKDGTVSLEDHQFLKV